MSDRAGYLSSSDSELLAGCEIDRFRASGPGGQKRNKTESAVRLRHIPSGVSAIATESRSQHENRARALRRLRHQLALELREPVVLDGYEAPTQLSELVSARLTRRQRSEPAYLLAVAAMLDVFVATACSLGDTARALGVSSNRLTRFIHDDDAVLRKVNELRAAKGLRPLRDL